MSWTSGERRSGQAIINVRLDDTDRRIIALLQQDGRMSSRAVSRRLGDIGDRAVRYRIDRLVRSGAIAISAVVDNERIGYPVLGDVIVEVPASQVRETLAELARDELVCYLGADLERGTVTIQVAARDEFHLQEWAKAMVGRVEGVVRVETTIVHQLAKDTDHWPPPSA